MADSGDFEGGKFCLILVKKMSIRGSKMCIIIVGWIKKAKWDLYIEL